MRKIAASRLCLQKVSSGDLSLNLLKCCAPLHSSNGQPDFDFGPIERASSLDLALRRSPRLRVSVVNENADPLHGADRARKKGLRATPRTFVLGQALVISAGVNRGRLTIV